MYRFAFVMDQQVGLRTQAMNFERVVAADPTIEAVWAPVQYTADAGLLTRLPGLPESVRGTLRGVHEIRDRLGDPTRFDSVLWATWAAKSVLKLVEGAPAFLIMDMTPCQMESMGKLYGYSRNRARFLGGMKRRSTDHLYAEVRHFFPWNKWVAESLSRDYGVPPAKITPTSPGVDTDLYRPDPSVKPSDGVVRLLFVGGDFRRKGGDLLMRWSEETRVKVPWEIHIVTRDEIEPSAKVTVHRNLGNNSPELVRLYQECDLFVLPTRADCYSLVGLEAMASGLPVILSNLGGIPDLVDDDRNGFLIAPDDDKTLFDRLDRLVSDPDLRQSMGKAAREKAERQFNCRVTNGSVIEAMKAAVR